MKLLSSFSSNGSLSLPTEPVVKQEPCWAPSTPQTPTTPTAALGQLGLADPFGHSFLHQQQQQHHHQVRTIKTENLEQTKTLQQMRTASKRRPGPYDNLKDPSGKINLDLVSKDLLFCDLTKIRYPTSANETKSKRNASKIVKPPRNRASAKRSKLNGSSRMRRDCALTMSRL